MSELFPLNIKPDENNKYFNYIFNKVEFNYLKVKNNFYNFRKNKFYKNLYKKTNNNLYLKFNSSINKRKSESNKNSIKTYSFENIKKQNIKLNKLKSSTFNINNNKSLNLNNNKSNNDDISNSYSTKNIPKINNSKKNTKSYQKYLKILSGSLDKELYNESNDKNINKESSKNNNLVILNNNTIKKNQKKNKLNLIDTIYIGNSVINNCLLRNKVIYDIKPLNKSEQKGRCIFYNEDIKNKKKNNNNIFFSAQKSINNSLNISEINNNNRKNKNYKLNSIDSIINNKKKNFLYEVENKKEIKNKLLNNKKINKINRFKENQLPLNILLSKDIQQFSGPNLKTFYGRGGKDMIRGEKIKFLKTCYQVKFIKPILTQKGYILNPNQIYKKVVHKNKNKKYDINHYNLDIIKKLNKNEIKKTKEKMKIIKRNIIQVFDWVDEEKEKLFDFKTDEY